MKGWRGLWLLVGVALLYGLAVGVGGVGAQVSGAPEWSVVDLPGPDPDFTGVFMQDRDNAWAAAELDNDGLACKLIARGNVWSVQQPCQKLSAGLRAIVAISDNNVWAVGVRGVIAHKDGAGWKEIANPEPGADLYTLQMLGGGEEGWAGGCLHCGTPSGGEAVLLHYKNGMWSRDASIRGPDPIRGLHFAQGGGYAVQAHAIWRYDGSAWAQEEYPPCPPGGYGCDQQLTGVRAVSKDEAWATGHRQHFGTTFSFPLAVAFHRVGGRWVESIPAAGGGIGPNEPVRLTSWLSAVSFSPERFGLAGGWYGDQFAAPGIPYILSLRGDGGWHEELLPSGRTGVVTAISQFDATHALAVGNPALILTYGYGQQPGAAETPTPRPTPSPVPNSPTDKVADPHNSNVTYFPVVGHTLAAGFREYWRQFGGLEQFGYPLTEAFTEKSATDGKSYLVQYFERARFEYHPENTWPTSVLLGLLGRTVTAGREGEAPFVGVAAPTNQEGRYFASTRHLIDPVFFLYWQQHGGLPIYGFPISEAFTEASATDGKPYKVQYFERNRLEYHPELAEAYRVSLGLLGVDVLRARGWLK